MSAEPRSLARAREIEAWIARVRLFAVLFATAEVVLFTASYPEGYETVAWIATANSIGKPTFVRQLQRLDTRGFAVLDSGRDVNAASLRLHGSRLSWKHATAARTATLR